MADLTNFLQAREGVRVLVERQVKHELSESFGLQVTELHGARNRSHHEVDLVITLGGDGLLMHANWLFQKSAPIILPVNLGSLGFLLPFEYEDIYPTLDRVLSQDVDLTLRMRLRCRIIRNGMVSSHPPTHPPTHLLLYLPIFSQVPSIHPPTHPPTHPNKQAQS